MSITLLEGDCRQTLAGLPPASVQCVITSPPYYSLRDYGTQPLIWGGDASFEHEHVWGEPLVRRGPAQQQGETSQRKGRSNVEAQVAHGQPQGQFCVDPACGAWRGSLGLEPSVDLYIAHLVEVLRQVRRVLRPDGTLWLNLGDAYAAGRSRGRYPGQSLDGKSTAAVTHVERIAGVGKNLLMMPFRVAMALQADGWYLRSVIPWLKRNSMPESVTDRPATAVEYVFLLAKRDRYFWDAEAVKMTSTGQSGQAANFARQTKDHLIPNQVFVQHRLERNGTQDSGTRSRRNSDWFFESWQGLLLDEEDQPLAFVVNPMPLKMAHFATFPPRLVEPMLKASTSERGQCPECGAPWRRTTETQYRHHDKWFGDKQDARHSRGSAGTSYDEPIGTLTTGWRATCPHTDLAPVPQSTLDPFGGAGTVGLVAERLGRHAVICDLNTSYVEMSHNRLETTLGPMFLQVERGNDGIAAATTTPDDFGNPF